MLASPVTILGLRRLRDATVLPPSARSTGMPLYYFDTRDGHHLIRDELGIELDGIAKARDEATRGLADLVKDALPGAVRRELSVQVRDDAERDVLRASVWFEIETLADD
jgi:hypothetical protein